MVLFDSTRNPRRPVFSQRGSYFITGPEKKLTKKKEQSTKTSKVRKKANVDSADIPKSSETTPAHSKVPKLLGSAGFSSSGKTKWQKNPGKNGEYRTKLDFDFSSSDDDDFQQIPVRRTPAHTNLPKDLGLTGGCKKDTNNQTPDFDDPKDELSRSCKTVLKGFDLSSSENEFEPEGTFPKSAANNAKPAESKSSREKVCDSFVEQVEEVEDTFISCVGESFVDQHDIPKTSQFEKEEFRKPPLSQKDNFSADDTIVQKPIHISPESFSPDMDTTFGQPPCESTRIHRRSSVSYKKLLGSPEDISSEASDDNKHYETCRPNVSGDEDNDESEDPFSVTAYEIQRNEKLGKKSSDEKPKPMDNEMKSDTDNSNNKKNNDLCEELHNLSLHQHDSPSDSQSVKSRKITDNIAPDNGYELKGTSSEQNFDESIEVIDVYTQTEQSMCEDDLSPLKKSLGEPGLSENTRKMVRKKSSSSIQNVTESKSDSDASEVEIKDISIQTDIRSDISEVDSNIDISIKDNDQVSPVEAIISHEKIEVTVVTSDSDKEECLSENESNCDNSEHRKDADSDNSASSEIRINERRNSDSGENASNISDIESSGESNIEPDVLSSESEDCNRNNDKKKLLKLKRKGTHKDKTDKERTSNVDDVSDDSEKYGNHLPDSQTAIEVKDAARNTWRYACIC